MGTKLFHKRSFHNGDYDFDALIAANPALSKHVQVSDMTNQQTVDFSDNNAILELNRAILYKHYGYKHWLIPSQNLCPGVPGRADYIHEIADLIGQSYAPHKFPTGLKVNILDIGTGASLIYPLIGKAVYGWSFVGTDTSQPSLDNAANIISKNELKDIKLILQKRPGHILTNIFEKDSLFDAVICNPPFHSSEAELKQQIRKKWFNIKKEEQDSKNFGGLYGELVYKNGGEAGFIKKMIVESKNFQKQCLWFSSLVSKKNNIPSLLDTLEKNGAFESVVIPIVTGNKETNILAWTFWKKKQRKDWGAYRWS